MSSKQLINIVQEVVEDNLLGFVSHNQHVTLIKDSNIILRKDLHELKEQRKVTLMTGGGSGHEPAFSGYVGSGMLTACVQGPIFTSPSSENILTCIRILAQNNKEGILVFVANYTGDRLNFGLAVEQALVLGINVEMLVFGEDCANIPRVKNAGRRGLAGFILFMKIAGAMAENGMPLLEIKRRMSQISQTIGTIGMSLSSCNLPGKGPLFQLDQDMYELGLGIHGEAGVAKHKLTSARDIVRGMIDHMRFSKFRFEYNEGDSVVLLVNNLGACSLLEMNIVLKEALTYLSELKLNVVRLYSGHFVTSIDMAGMSLTLQRASSEIVDLLNAPCFAPSWPKAQNAKSYFPSILEAPEFPKVSNEIIDDGPQLSSWGQNLLKLLILRVCEVMINCEHLLNKLDQEVGDGDTGSTMKRGAEAILENMSSMPCLNPKHTLLYLSSTCAPRMGGTSGAIYSLMLTGAAIAFKSVNQVNLAMWTEALKQALNSIMKYSGSQPGDRTMIDPLNSVKELLVSKLELIKDMDIPEMIQILGQCAETAEREAEETAKMDPGAGRASYANKDRLKSPDPGAQAVAIWMRTIYQTTKNFYETNPRNATEYPLELSV